MEQCTDDEVVRMLSFVSSQRREEALKFKFTAGRFACLKSYMMLRDIFVDLHLIDCDEHLVFEYGKYGKPSIVGYPDIHFNISHCPNAIAVAVSDHPVGIDIEAFHNPDEQLMLRTMNADERQTIISSTNPAETFTRLWTQKESRLKCLGIGLIEDIPMLLTSSKVFTPHGEYISNVNFTEETYVCQKRKYVWSVCSKMQ